MAHIHNKHGWCRPIKRGKIYWRDNYICGYCFVDMKSTPQMLSLDHIIPHEMDGTNDSTNLITSCQSCNSSKNSYTIDQWANNQHWTMEKLNNVMEHIGKQIATPLISTIEYKQLFGQINDD